MTSPLPHNSLAARKTVWFGGKAQKQDVGKGDPVPYLPLTDDLGERVLVTYSLWTSISLAVESGYQISKVLFSSNLQSRWLHLPDPISPGLPLEL